MYIELFLLARDDGRSSAGLGMVRGSTAVAGDDGKDEKKSKEK